MVIDKEYTVCTRCIMDTTDQDITFDSEGVCNHCKSYSQKVKFGKVTDNPKQKLEALVDQIKQSGKNRKYDCIVGISGGVDSSYVALLAKELGLRALLVHLDNGWNSEIAVKNIKNIAKHTGFDLYTHVIDWNEFRDIQLSLFKASVVDIEIATDHAIKAIVFKTAAKFGVKYLLNGGNVITEAIMPVSWRHMKADKRNLLDIYRQFGTKKLKTYPTAGILKQQYYKMILNIKNITILNYFDFDKHEAIERLKSELSWQEYGGKHHESIFTRFYQAYILPKKFNIDKRRCHLSNLICANQIERDEALKIIEQPVYDPQLMKTDREFILKKLGFSEDEFKQYIESPGVSHFQYKSDIPMIERLLKIREKVRGY